MITKLRFTRFEVFDRSLGSSCEQVGIPYVGNLESINVFNTFTDGWILSKFQAQFSSVTFRVNDHSPQLPRV